MQDLEKAIRERAYHLWVKDGCPDGNADANWLAAQREILASTLESFARVTISDSASSGRGAKKPEAKGKDIAKKKRRVA